MKLASAFKLHGRIDRKTYWIWLAIYVVASMGVLVAAVAIAYIYFNSLPGSAGGGAGDVFAFIMLPVALILSQIVQIPIGFAFFTFQVRRLHDLNLTGWIAGAIYLTMTALAIIIAVLLFGGSLVQPLTQALESFLSPLSKILGWGVPVFNVVLGLLPGTKTVNRFGEAPLHVSEEATTTVVSKI